jgi:predicted short-subunit dehydrogenase-like oxidoreductase (DUF2520 family)
MDIVLIGSGNAATILGRKSRAAGHRIVQVYSRNGNHANQLANRLGAISTSYISTIERNTDLMIIALKDEALVPFLKDLNHTNSTAVHTAGAIGMNVLKGVAKNYGVLYPLQSLSRETETIPVLTMLTQGNDPETGKMIRDFAYTIAEIVIEAGDQDRLKYHLAATIVNNFSNYLYILTEAFCRKENLSFSVLQPLMEETVMRLRSSSPASVQTGAAIRNDLTTLEKHRELLKEYPAILNLYKLFTEEIQKLSSGLRL